MNRWGASYRQGFAHISSFQTHRLGFSLSYLGDTISRVALTWFVYESTHSPEALGLLSLFYTGPVILGGLVAGWLLDRFDRRRVMMADSLLRAAIFMLIPILNAAGMLALWHVYAVAAVYGFLMMIPLAGGPTIVPTLVPREQLADGECAGNAQLHARRRARPAAGRPVDRAHRRAERDRAGRPVLTCCSYGR